MGGGIKQGRGGGGESAKGGGGERRMTEERERIRRVYGRGGGGHGWRVEEEIRGD